MNVEEWIIACAGSIIEYSDVVEKFGHLEVIKEYCTSEDGFVPFPQSRWTHRNISVWVLLNDGSAIGWNESPTRGWNFPRIGKKTVDKNFKNG